jgi:hypothetical protein
MTELGGVLYIPYAGLNGDCDPAGGNYFGFVVGIDTTSRVVTSYKPQSTEGGIWGAITSDGVGSVWAVTGNSKHAMTAWGGSEALIRFTAGPKFSGATSDYFTPSNWHHPLDDMDTDLGSAAPVLFDMPGAATHAQLAVVGGKGGVAILLDRMALGGIGTGDGTTGEGLSSLSVTGGELLGSPASYVSTQARYVVLYSNGPMSGCPKATSGNLMALKVTLTPTPALTPVWCANEGGSGSPIATTTDGTDNALVWVVGNNVLQAFDGDTGAAVFTGTGGQLAGVEKWTSPIVAKGRFIIAGNGNVYAYKLP